VLKLIGFVFHLVTNVKKDMFIIYVILNDKFGYSEDREENVTLSPFLIRNCSLTLLTPLRSVTNKDSLTRISALPTSQHRVQTKDIFTCTELLKL
jgi:hypothetical protein